jgi:hypothetical protein
MPEPATLHVTNFASRGRHGPGPLLHIMAAPPAFVLAHAAGRAPALIPQGREQDLMRDLLRRRQRGEILPTDDPALTAYRATYTARLRAIAALPRPEGWLPRWPAYTTANCPPQGLALPDGATLVCTCAVSEAAAGRCHRVWAAAVLAEAGYRVILDGQPLTHQEPRP